MTAKNVLILAGDSYKAVGAIFEKRGWNVFYDGKLTSETSLVVFTGGTDVDPMVYDEEPGPFTQSPDKARDAREIEMFQECAGHDFPMVGICRGGQLLNVLNGGSMIQHLGKTISGDVMAHDYDSDSHVQVRVDHHQGIVRKYGASKSILAYDMGEPVGLTYACWYPETKSLCVQFHPEWLHEPTEKYFFELIDRYVGD